MSLPLHVHGGYPSYAESGVAWDQNDYDAYKFAKALKGEPFNGYATLKSIGGKWLKITSDHPEAAFQLFGSWAARVIDATGVQSAYAVPVPGSQCVAFDTDVKGRRLCDAIAAHRAGIVTEEAFHWSEAMVPAHKGGPRRKAELVPMLRFWTKMPKDRPVILVDDVATLHGHMKACAEILRDHGHDVMLALAGAQTVHERPHHSMFDFPVIDLDAPEPSPFADWKL